MRTCIKRGFYGCIVYIKLCNVLLQILAHMKNCCNSLITMILMMVMRHTHAHMFRVSMGHSSLTRLVRVCVHSVSFTHQRCSSAPHDFLKTDNTFMKKHREKKEQFLVPVAPGITTFCVLNKGICSCG